MYGIILLLAIVAPTPAQTVPVPRFAPLPKFIPCPRFSPIPKFSAPIAKESEGQSVTLEVNVEVQPEVKGHWENRSQCGPNGCTQVPVWVPDVQAEAEQQPQQTAPVYRRWFRR